MRAMLHGIQGCVLLNIHIIGCCSWAESGRSIFVAATNAIAATIVRLSVPRGAGNSTFMFIFMTNIKQEKIADISRNQTAKSMRQ